MWRVLTITCVFLSAFTAKAQEENCNLRPPAVTIHFGSGDHEGLNQMISARYERIPGSCPSDGHFTFTPSTSGCFRGDWHTITSDHTPGDNQGNMLLVNSSYRTGIFFGSEVKGLKPNTRYEFGVWMMNVCRITEKCPFPLLPDITIQLQSSEGKNVALLSAGEVDRVHQPEWQQYQFMFTTPANSGELSLVMVNNNPGGCGNDFVLDDITFRECVILPPKVVAKKTTPAKKAAVVKKTTTAPKETTPKTNQTTAKVAGPKTATSSSATVTPPPKTVHKAATKPVAKATPKPPVKKEPKPVVKKTAPPAAKTAPPVASRATATPEKRAQNLDLAKTSMDSVKMPEPPPARKKLVLPPPPPALKSRTNSLVKQIFTDAGEIKIDLYDNGEIDDDTVSIYHNNRLLAARARLSQKPITFRIQVNEQFPHHEFVMVADNLGSIPPNTSLMIVTAGDKRHEVFISSTKQKNAKVVLDLKE